MDFQEIISSVSLDAMIFFIIGIACIAIAVFATTGNKKLRETGLTADGIIFRQEQSDSHSGSTDFTSNVKDKIIVRFLTKDDLWITEQVNRPFLISYSGQYKEGEKVKVIYNLENPSEFMLETRQSEKTGRSIVFIAGIIFVSVGLFQWLV